MSKKIFHAVPLMGPVLVLIGFLLSVRSQQSANGEEPGDPELKPVRGILVAKDSGEAIAGAEIQLFWNADNYGIKTGKWLIPFMKTTTRPDGTFAFADGIDTGSDYFLIVSGRDIASFATETLKGQEPQELRVEAPETGGWVSGTVADATGAPVADGEVQAITERRTGMGTFSPIVATARPDGSGIFVLGPLVYGEYRIEYDGKERGRGQTHVVTIKKSVPGELPPSFSFTVGSRRWIDVEVIDREGNPIRHTPIKVSLKSGELTRSLPGHTDETGRARINDALPGKYAFSATNGSYWGYVEAEISNPVNGASPPVSLQIGLHDTHLKGRVKFADGRPAPKAHWVLRPAFDSPLYGFSFFSDLLQGEADEAGLFSIDHIPPGKYNWDSLSGPSIRYSNGPVAFSEVKEGEIAQVDLVALPSEGSSLTGTVVNASGAPIADARVFCLKVTGWTTTDAEGRWTLEGFKPASGKGTYLVAFHEKFSTAVVPFSDAQSLARSPVVLSPAVQVFVEITNESGDALDDIPASTTDQQLPLRLSRRWPNALQFSLIDERWLPIANGFGAPFENERLVMNNLPRGIPLRLYLMSDEVGIGPPILSRGENVLSRGFLTIPSDDEGPLLIRVPIRLSQRGPRTQSFLRVKDAETGEPVGDVLFPSETDREDGLVTVYHPEDGEGIKVISRYPIVRASLGRIVPGSDGTPELLFEAWETSSVENPADIFVSRAPRTRSNR